MVGMRFESAVEIGEVLTELSLLAQLNWGMGGVKSGLGEERSAHHQALLSTLTYRSSISRLRYPSYDPNLSQVIKL